MIQFRKKNQKQRFEYENGLQDLGHWLKKSKGYLKKIKASSNKKRVIRKSAVR